MFITFEGIEGSGKTTQQAAVARYLVASGYEVVQTREPGGTLFGQHIRQWLLDPNHSFAHMYTEVLLFYADRLEHVQSVILPALQAKKVVLCDRYIDSTIAYQVGGRQIPIALIDQLNQWVNCEPDLTILLDLDPKEGISRAKNRASLDRFEQESLAFHTRVRDRYNAIAVEHCARVKSIDVSQKSPQAVFEEIKQYLDAYLGVTI